jgi:hypothetical protein
MHNSAFQDLMTERKIKLNSEIKLEKLGFKLLLRS